MNLLIMLAILASAALGGVLGALAPQLYRLLRDQPPDAVPPSSAAGLPPLDPDLQRRIHDLSTIWAASRGHPEAAHLAGRYLADAARDAQARWERLR